MKRLNLVRLDYKTSEGTFGAILVEGKLFCLTLELPFLYNIRSQSCIPIGEYTCTYREDPNRESYHVKDVPRRDGILIHAGNGLEDTTGCILVGMAIGKVNNRRAVLGSKKAVELLITTMKKKDFLLNIEEWN